MTDQPDSGPVTHAYYRREPYVRATPDDGTTVDGKAVGWTRDQVDVKWQTSDRKMHVQLFDADRVQRIKRGTLSADRPIYFGRWGGSFLFLKRFSLPYFFITVF